MIPVHAKPESDNWLLDGEDFRDDGWSINEKLTVSAIAFTVLLVGIVIGWAL